MWGSLFDATKDFAEKARKAAEELERNLNDSAGIPSAVSSSSITANSEQYHQQQEAEEEEEEESQQQHTSLQEQVNDDDNIYSATHGDHDVKVKDDIDETDAWDDDDMDMDNIDLQIEVPKTTNQIENDASIDATTKLNEIVDVDNVKDMDNHATILVNQDTSQPESQPQPSSFHTEEKDAIPSERRELLELQQATYDAVVEDQTNATPTRTIAATIEPEAIVSSISAPSSYNCPVEDETASLPDTFTPTQPNINMENSATVEASTADGIVPKQVKQEEQDGNDIVDVKVERETEIVLPGQELSSLHEPPISVEDVSINDKPHTDDFYVDDGDGDGDGENHDTVVNTNIDEVDSHRDEKETQLYLDAAVAQHEPPQQQQQQQSLGLISNSGIGLLTSFFGAHSTSNTNTTTSIMSTTATRTDADLNTEEVEAIVPSKQEHIDPTLQQQSPYFQTPKNETKNDYVKNDDDHVEGFDDDDNNNESSTKSTRIVPIEQEVNDNDCMDNSYQQHQTTENVDHKASSMDMGFPIQCTEVPRADLAMTESISTTTQQELHTSGQSKLPAVTLDATSSIESMIEIIMSNATSRQLLEQKYRLVTRSNAQVDNEITKKSFSTAMMQVQEDLQIREQQLVSKTEQMTMMEAMFEEEKQELLIKIQNTKDEAKRRIQKAKERVDAVELKLKNTSSQQSSSVAAQAETIQQQATMIVEIRKEGEKLAQKQADMELVVRTSKAETRELRKQITELEEETNTLSEKLNALQADYTTAQNELASARQGMSRLDQLDTEFRSAREENEKRATKILTLEQLVKESKVTIHEMESELKVTRKGAAIETEQERKRLVMGHKHMISDMEMKLQATEREAAVREDSLRVEIDDLRKRWQDSVRRADTLSVDMQANTAPLLRQIDSINKQSRIRATAWAELETQLRNEIESSIVVQETLTKECNEWKTKYGRLDRTSKDSEAELKQLQAEVFDKNEALQKLQHQHDGVVYKLNKLQVSHDDIERLSNESIARLRSDMTRTLVDNEERYRSQMEDMELQLQEERNQRSNLEVQLLEQQSYRGDNGAIQVPDIDASNNNVMPQAKINNGNENQHRLRNSEDQAEILAGALGGFDREDDDMNESDATESNIPTYNGSMNSYAALEQLTSRLKASKMELSTLRTRLMESEKVRTELLAMVDESRIAREKLPLVEQRVQELTVENRDLQLEIQGLRDDIADVQELYRTQLNVLLESQAVNHTTEKSPGISSTNDAELKTET
jgi:TATA element modulatory factor